MSEQLLRQLSAEELPTERLYSSSSETLEQAETIVNEVRFRGEKALHQLAVHYGDLGPNDPLVIPSSDLHQILSNIDPKDRQLLERTAQRIRSFAESQRQALSDIETPIPGGSAGHRVVPMQSAACYAPGGRYPLPSSVLMTAVTAQTAGVKSIWVASPNPTPITCAAAAVSGADALVAVGGAQVIAAFAYGTESIPACDIIVGPGNRWVTAAKQLVNGRCAIDLLAGPSELLVLADASADPDLIAADLLAQAEHDNDVLPILITLDPALFEKVNDALANQLKELPTAQTARAALANGFCTHAEDIDQAISLCNKLAPEHLQLMLSNSEELAAKFTEYGGLFIGAQSAEVFGDYGAGPNHTLPTGGTARFSGGLSVFNFLRIHTFLHIEDPQQAKALNKDCVDLARIEGLEAHARAAERRQ